MKPALGDTFCHPARTCQECGAEPAHWYLHRLKKWIGNCVTRWLDDPTGEQNRPIDSASAGTHNDSQAPNS